MKEINEIQLENAVFEAASKMCFSIDNSVKTALENTFKSETGFAKDALSDILENIQIAEQKHIPVCQDTGIVIVFAEIGNKVFLNCDFEKTINKAIARAYKAEYLRKSVVKSPVDRINTTDNTPAIVHTKIVEGEMLKLTLCPKGAGSENMGKVKMLTPASGIEGIEDFVVETVKSAGGKACPPLIVGVGIGGDMEKCAILSKEALLRKVEDKNPDKILAEIEGRILQKINSLGMGAMGLKGKTLALAVKAEAYPCHIASLPVAVSLMCHAARHAEVIL